MSSKKGKMVFNIIFLAKCNINIFCKYFLKRRNLNLKKHLKYQQEIRTSSLEILINLLLKKIQLKFAGDLAGKT